MNSRNPSPLRYPGGKFKISKLIALLIEKSQTACDTYVEPFAGGAGVALDLLMDGLVERIVINDSDRAISSIWKAMTESNSEFLDKMMCTEISLAEWKRQRAIYFESRKYSLDYGFAAFFLNRTNHSGILGSGPIGGMKQEGAWKLDVRFNKAELAKKIKAIGELGGQIKVFNRDVFSFIRNQLPRVGARAFAYFDPPYYCRGKVLYQNFFTEKLHKELSRVIQSSVAVPWIVSYDSVPAIKDIYKGLPKREFSLNYSLANNGYGREVMFFKDKSLVPTKKEIISIGMENLFYGEVV